MNCMTLHKILSYDPKTGVFRRNSTGRVVGSKMVIGYLTVTINSRAYFCHRLAWFYMYGVWPLGIIDHINRNKEDNRIANLRTASKGQNAINSKIVRAWSGYRGVYYQSNTRKWRAKLGKIHLGYFLTKKAAHGAYRAKASELYGEYLPT